MTTKKVIRALKKLYKAIDEFVELVGLEYTDDDEYICRNVDDDEWCYKDILSSIENAHTDIDIFLDEIEED